MSSLRDYIWNKEGIDIDKLQDSNVEAIPLVSKQAFQHASGSNDLNFPSHPIPNFARLIEAFLKDPSARLEAALDKITSELLELEKIHKVALVNPAVADEGRRARQSWQRAQELWAWGFARKAQNEALRAVEFGIKSLIAGYQHTAAHKIVGAREYLEDEEWILDIENLLLLHKKARSQFAIGRVAQDALEFDKARRQFKSAMLSIRELYLDAERIRNRW